MYSNTPQELGYPQVKADDVNLLGPPVGGGRVPVPHYDQFMAIWNSAYRQYRYYNGDEAIRDNLQNALAMRRDPVIGSALRARKMPTALLSWHIEPDNEAVEEEVQAANAIEQNIKKSPHLQQFLWWQLEALWYGRYGCQTAYQWQWKDGKQFMVPRQYWPVNGDKLVFKYGGQVGIRVRGSWDEANKRTTVSDYGRVYWFDENEREQLTINKFEPEDADFTEADMAGAIHGVGLRSKLYWAWALKNQIQGMLFDYLNWFARGLTVYYYEQGNPRAYQELRTRIEQHQGKPFLAFPRMKDGGPGYKPIERFEPGTASTDLLKTVAIDYYDDLMTRAILGQTLSSGTGATGMGSGVAKLHGETLDQVIKYDSNNLADTLTQDFLRPQYRVNYPGMQPGRWVFEIDTPNVDQMLEAAQVYYEMGGSIDDSSFRESTGLPAPKPGGTILSKLQSTQPAAVDGTPMGVPVVQGEQPNVG